jgi:hypothetical protein
MENRVEDISEKRIKQVLDRYLTSRGWKTVIAWNEGHGIDIEAIRGMERWIIQVNSCNLMRSSILNAFLSVLGEVIQRMDDPDCKYSIALPDREQFRRLWERLPLLAKHRLGITALFVKPAGDVAEEA